MKLYQALFSQWFAIGYIASISFLLTIVLARVLGPDKFGTYSYVLSFASIFAIIQNGGYRTIIYREGISDNIDKVCGNLFQYALGHVVLVTGVGLFVVILLDLELKTPLLIAIICFGLLTITSFFSAHLKAEGRFVLDSGWQLTVRSFTVVLILSVLFFLPLNVTYIFLGWILGLVIALSLPWFKFIWRRPIFRSSIKSYRSCVAFLIIDAATVFYFRSDILLLQYFHDIPSDVGQYAVAYKFLEGFILIATPLALIAFRTLRLRWEKNINSTLLLFKLIFVMLISSIFIVILSKLFGENFILFTFGAEYDLAGKLLFWLMLALLFILPNYILSQSVIAFNLEWYYAFSVIFAAVLNVVLNILWIPEYGTFGAAVATIVTEGVLCLSLIIILRKSLRVSNDNRC